jgi:peptidyl-prolyl cis-trans isomerase D
MLDGMRRAAQNWVGKTILTIVFSFLIVSFAIWGIGDIFRGIGVSNVAEVGSTAISTAEFRQNYQTQITNLQRQTRRAITNEQARAFGLDQQVLGRMISEAALDQKVRALNLAISDETIGRMILEDPVFKGGDGRFDRTRFNDVLRDNGYTEQSFVREQRKNYLRQDVVETVTGRVSVPLAMQDAIHRYASETRAVEYVVLPDTAAGEIAPPKDEDLNTWFEIRKATWRAPEYRKIVTLAVTPATIADPSQVSDADARAQYERVKGERFGTAETRDVQQLVFPTEDAAKAAHDKISKGVAFLDIAKEQGRSEADVSLGSVARSAILDPAVAEAAFTTSAGHVSQPVKGRFGYVLVQVGSITEGRTKPFDEVANEMKQDIAISRARSKVTQIHDAIEDERASGKPLAEAAQKVALQVTTIDSVDASGLDKTGKPVALRDADNVLRAVFASDIGVDNEAVNTRDNGYVWFEVLGIEQAHDRKLDEVKDEVMKAWREDEIRRALTSKAIDLVKAMDAGETLEKIARDIGGLLVQSANDVRRGGAANLPAGVVAQIFNLPVGRAGSAAGDGLTRILFKVNDSVVPVFDPQSEEAKAIAVQLAQNLGNDLLLQYLAKVQTDLGVKINGAALNLAVGGGDAY